MITIKQEEKLIDKLKGLTELEFSAILKEMANHIHRNNWNHMIDKCFDIETFESELDDMTDSRDMWRDRASRAEDTLNEIRDLL